MKFCYNLIREKVLEEKMLEIVEQFGIGIGNMAALEYQGPRSFRFWSTRDQDHSQNDLGPWHPKAVFKAVMILISGTPKPSCSHLAYCRAISIPNCSTVSKKSYGIVTSYIRGNFCRKINSE